MVEREAPQKGGISRREFLGVVGKSAAGLALGSTLLGRAPYVSRAASLSLTVGVGGWAVEPLRRVIDELGFTKETGITVDIQVRPGSPPEFIAQMASAVNAGTSPYDVIDIEDEAAITFSRAGWLDGVDDLLSPGFWNDFPKNMQDMVEVWYRYQGETFRVPHNYETQYFWYRKDWLDQKGLKPPETWDEMVEVGKELTGNGVFGVSDGLAKGAYLNVYVAYLTTQAGGNPFDFDEPFVQALQFIHDMMYKHQIFPVAALNKNYDALNVDYMNDRVGMMRQWPFFYDVSRGNTAWWSEEKTQIALPPKGPANRKAYAAAWGWAIPRTAPHKREAQEFFRWINAEENAAKMAEINTWFLSARHSVMNAIGDRGMARYLKWYSESDAIGTRPFHPGFMEGVSVVEDLASAFLTNQMSLDEVVRQGKRRMQQIRG